MKINEIYKTLDVRGELKDKDIEDWKDPEWNQISYNLSGEIFREITKYISRLEEKLKDGDEK